MATKLSEDWAELEDKWSQPGAPVATRNWEKQKVSFPKAYGGSSLEEPSGLGCEGWSLHFGKSPEEVSLGI